MGNYISCTLSGPHGKHSRGAKVIFPSGEIRQFDGPTNAAEIMFDTPNHFLVNSRSLQIGRRFSALSADEDLEMGDVYVVFPMKRVNSVVAAADMGALWMAASSAVRRASGGQARILPESVQNEPAPAPRLSLEDGEDVLAGEFKYRLSTCRSRKPVLETITEENVCSR